MLNYAIYFIIGIAFAYWYNKKYVQKFVAEKNLANDSRIALLCFSCVFWPFFVTFFGLKKFLTKFSS